MALPNFIFMKQTKRGIQGIGLLPARIKYRGCLCLFFREDVMLPEQQLKETVRRMKEFSILDNNGNRIRFVER